MNFLINNMVNVILVNSKNNLESVIIPYKKVIVNILKVLQKEGYIHNYKQEKNKIYIYLKYKKGMSVIQNFKIISKSSCRIYSKVSTLIKQQELLGFFIISTSKGIMTDKEAIFFNLGGEVLLKVN